MTSLKEPNRENCRLWWDPVQHFLLLFAPFLNLGLIIIDEEHESSYKSENSPRYHARETAIHRAKLEGARVILGSATPSMEAYYRAKEGEYVLVKLEARFEERPLPRVSILT